MKKNLVLADHELGKRYLGICGSAFNGLELGSGQTHLLLKRGGELKSGLQNLIDNLVAPRTCAVEEARSIMGNNFFGLDDAVKHFGVTSSKRYSALLAEVPWNKEVLTACKDTHILIAVFPMSIFDMRDAVKGKFTIEDGPRVPHQGQWWEQEAFAREKGKLGWHLIQKTNVEGSGGRRHYSEQRALLLKDERVPMVRVMVYSITGHFLNTGEGVGSDCVRCSDIVLSSATDVLRPELRYNGDDLLQIHHARDTEAGSNLFLFAEKIPMRA